MGFLNWRDQAECRKVDPELFFPVGTGRAAQQQTEAAKAVCRQCAVVCECLTAARGNGGVWGGTTEDERRAARRTGR